MTRPRLLDLFCGAGGAAMGYHRAGFKVVGVDINPQPRFPFEFHQADAMTYPLEGYDVIHASPPCQRYCSIGKMYRSKMPKRERVDLIAPIRQRLIKSGLPYVIENVQGAPLLNPRRVCGSYFGLGVRRHRFFETNISGLLGTECRHRSQTDLIAVYGDHPERCRVRTDGKGGKINRAPTLEAGQGAMGIDWMVWKELTQAIPPAYTEWIGKQIMRKLEGK